MNEVVSIRTNPDWGKRLLRIAVFFLGISLAVLSLETSQAQSASEPLSEEEKLLRVLLILRTRSGLLDSDGDGTFDTDDAFPDDPSESTDTDLDGVGDNADAFPDDPTETADNDEDDVGNNTDNCPDTANADQLDIDSDNLGDACDPVTNAVWNQTNWDESVWQ